MGPRYKQYGFSGTKKEDGKIMNPSQTERLLSYLKNTPLLESYCLSIYPSDKISVPDKINRHLCGSQGIQHLCHKICLPSIHEQIETATSTRQPVFFRCPLGLFSFAIPLPDNQCLVCSGMRENLFDLYFYGSEQFESLKEKQNIHPYEILEQLEQLPVSTEKKVKETMSKVERLISTYFSGEKTSKEDSSANLDKILSDVSAEIESVDNFKKASSIFGESLGILLDSPLILIATRDEESNCCLIEACWGTFRGSSYLHSKKLPTGENVTQAITLTDDEVRELFPDVEMNRVLCIPIPGKEDILGMVFIFEVCLTPQDTTLIENLTGKLGDKLKSSIRDREANLQMRDVRLLEMIRTLALTESQDDLMRLIMEMSAELVQASNGSLMMMDKSGKNLRITAALGMSQILAKSFTTKIGEGIAGKVAASGIPLLVKDIEHDLNLGRRNRVRFGTKSCISLPLRLKGNVIGVLNLADKKNNVPFTRADQEILTTFIDQAIIILERTTTLKKAILNTITDPLTGLYNLRFIRKRLNEELSRSIRYNLRLSMIILSISPKADRNIPQVRATAGPVLKEIARVLSSSLRDIDLVGRFGESEFCVILPSTPPKEAMLVAERIQRNVRKELGNIKQIQDTYSTSIGIASFPDDGASPGDIINAARTALSRAEGENENKICAMLY
jgi:diguanylate cyclase (GGDEF)-like protein